MTPQWPFKTRFIVNQEYESNPLDNSGNPIYKERHGGLDLLPLDDKGRPFPAEIYPVLDGSEISIQDTDVAKGKGVKTRTELDPDFIGYLKSKGLVPAVYAKRVWLDILYWHCLDVIDKDGQVNQDTFIAHAGNTGYVFSSGNPVPDSQKGKPPYPGLHTHLEMYVIGENIVLNTDKDRQGRIDPRIILNYKGTSMFRNYKVKLITEKGEAFGVLTDTPNTSIITKAEDETEWRSYSKMDSYGVHTVNQDNSTDWTVDKVIDLTIN